MDQYGIIICIPSLLLFFSLRINSIQPNIITPTLWLTTKIQSASHRLVVVTYKTDRHSIMFIQEEQKPLGPYRRKVIALAAWLI